MLTFALVVAAKAAAILALAWLASVALRHRSAAARHLVWTLGVTGAVVMPLACWLLPALSMHNATLARASSIVGDAVVVHPSSQAASAPASVGSLVGIVWLLGTLAVAARSLRSMLAARRLVRASTPLAAGVPGAQVRTSTAVASPMTTGILRPTIVLPASASEWSAQRLRTVLLHEVAHVQRRDLAVQLLAQLACALFWWNPLTWLAAARLTLEREHACDDRVLAAGILPSSYASDLLDLARSATRTPFGAAAACMATSATEARLVRILDAKTSRAPLRALSRLGLPAVALACVAVLGCAAAEGASTASLSVGTPSVRSSPWFGSTVFMPSVDVPAVTAEVQRRLPALQACYARRVAAKPKLAGSIVIHWVITESGSVAEKCITSDTVGDYDLADCVNALVSAGSFPAANGGSVDVEYPFVFGGN